MANWYDFLVPNAVGDARKDIEPSVSQYRGTNGRLDPNAIMPLVPDEEKPGAELAIKIGEMRRQALDNYSRPNPLTWNQHLAGALQEISVPIAYAQGNRSYAEHMMPNTILKKHQARTTAWEDESRKTALGINDETLSGIGNSALEYHKTVRARRQAAKEMAAKSIAAASARGPEAVAQATKMAAEYMRSIGMTQDAEALEKRVSTPPVPGGGGPVGGAVSTPVPGISVTQPQQAQQGMAPQVQNPDAPQRQMSSAPNFPVPLSPKRAMAELIMPYNEDAGKAMLKEAETEEAPGLEGAKEAAKEYAKAEQARQTKFDNANEMAPKVAGLFDQLDKYADVAGMENYTGAIEGSMIAPYTTDFINSIRPSNKATPAIRDQIRGTQMALVALLKNTIRTPGEGSQDKQEFQAVIDTIGDMANANTLEDYHTKLRDSKQRIELLTGVKIPTQSKRLSAESDATIDETPQRTSVEKSPPAASMPIGATRTKMINGAPVTFEKTVNGWVEVETQPQASAQQPAQFYPRGAPMAGR